MNSEPRQCYEFGSFRIDAAKRRLIRDGEIVPLTPKAFDTLVFLIEGRGRLVEKEVLMEKLWPGVFVEENNLTQNISALRKALGEKKDKPQYIATVSGLGYRFIADVTDNWFVDDAGQNGQPTESANGTAGSVSESAVAASKPIRRPSRVVLAAYFVIAAPAIISGIVLLANRVRHAHAVSANPQIRSIAILPFKSLVAGEGDEYLGLGMADALITRLSSINQVTVRPTNAILKYTNANEDLGVAGRELEVDSVLDGRVQKSGDRIRVTVQLIRASDGAPLWGDKVDERYTDVFSLEDRISEEVAASLTPTLTGAQKQQLARHYTEDTEAYQSYVKGRFYWNKRDSDGLKKAIGYFEDAILKDPNYALAYAGLADSYAALGVVEDQPSQELMPKARSAALRALEIDDQLAEAHASLGYVKHRFEWDWVGAEREFKRAIELKSDYSAAHQWYGWYLLSAHRFDEAQFEFKRAEQIDPLSLYTNLTAGMPYFYQGQYDKAASQYKKVSEMDPNFWLAHRWLGKTYEQQGKYDNAIAEFQTVIKLHGGDVGQAPALGCVYALAGRQGEARNVLAELLRVSKEKYVSPYAIAILYAALGEKQNALDQLDKELKERGDGMCFLLIEERFESLRSEPRFLELVKRVGIPQ